VVDITLPQERRMAMLEELHQHGKLVATELSKRFSVSEDTIRRDLRDMATAGLLKRVHGGALPISPAIRSYAQRAGEIDSARQKLALQAADLVHDGQVVLFGGGTTNLAIAQNLNPNLRATAVSVSPQIALQLAKYPHIEVILVGGALNKEELMVTDAQAIAQLKQFQADLCFLGVCSLHPDAGISTGVYAEVELVRTLIAHAADVVATVTADKLGTLASFVIASCDRITHLITESQVSGNVLEKYRALGIQVSVEE